MNQRNRTVTALSMAVLAGLLSWSILDGCVSRSTDSGEPASPIHGPWTDERAEIVALIASGEVVAPRELYDSVCHHLSLVESQWCGSIPELCNEGECWEIEPHLGWVPSQLFCRVDDTTLLAMQEGRYSAWDHLNDYYWLDTIRFEPIGPSTYLYLTFVPLLNPVFLIPEYEALPGILEVEVSRFLGGPPNGISLDIEDGTYSYTYCAVCGFVDCESGCGCSLTWRFRIDGDSAILESESGR